MEYTHGGACFHVGDTINSDTTHIHVQVWLLLGAGNKATGSHGELYPSPGELYPSPQGTAGLSAEEAAPFSIPANGGKGLIFPTSLPTFATVLSIQSPNDGSPRPRKHIHLDQGRTIASTKEGVLSQPRLPEHRGLTDGPAG